MANNSLDKGSDLSREALFIENLNCSSVSPGFFYSQPREQYHTSTPILGFLATVKNPRGTLGPGVSDRERALPAELHLVSLHQCQGAGSDVVG